MSKYAVALLPWAGGISVLAVGLCILPTLRDRSIRTSPMDWTAHDSEPGKVIDLPTKDLFGKPIRPKARTLIVFAGSCSQCSLNAVPPSKLQKSPFDQVLLVSWSSEKQLRQTSNSPDPKVRLVADAKARIVEGLGAASAPRFYIVDNGVLTSVWKDTHNWPIDWTGEKSD